MLVKIDAKFETPLLHLKWLSISEGYNTILLQAQRAEHFAEGTLTKNGVLLYKVELREIKQENSFSRNFTEIKLSYTFHSVMNMNYKCHHIWQQAILPVYSLSDVLAQQGSSRSEYWYFNDCSFPPVKQMTNVMSCAHRIDARKIFSWIRDSLNQGSHRNSRVTDRDEFVSRVEWARQWKCCRDVLHQKRGHQS